MARLDAKAYIKKVHRLEQNQQKKYLKVMAESVYDSGRIKAFLQNALTDKINDREMFMKGIYYSYYYEEAD